MCLESEDLLLLPRVRISSLSKLDLHCVPFQFSYNFSTSEESGYVPIPRSKVDHRVYHLCPISVKLLCMKLSHFNVDWILVLKDYPVLDLVPSDGLHL